MASFQLVAAEGALVHHLCSFTVICLKYLSKDGIKQQIRYLRILFWVLFFWKSNKPSLKTKSWYDSGQWYHHVKTMRCVKCFLIWKFSGSHFPACGLNTEIVNLCIMPECQKIRTRETRKTDTFHSMSLCMTVVVVISLWS